jgi:dTDP-4-amino-4,6-dideoxygalactose transaminase
MKVTIEACRELISLPMYPQLTAEQIEYVAANVLEFL